MTLTGTFTPMPVFAVMLLFGLERAFMAPAVQSLAPNLIPPEDLSNAVAWNSSSWQAATIIGPVAGGLLYGLGADIAYAVALALLLVSSVLVIMIPKPAQRMSREKPTWTSLLAGFSFIRSEKIVLGAISLDLFAVLLGGATALMPIFARDVLTVGPWGLGLLRSAPGVGAIVTAILLASFPISSRAGMLMFIGVAIFGAGTVVFGLSTSVWLSVVALAVMGAADMISVYVRETLIALWTPDEVRGRVNAVNMVFVGASNELGEFRAGTMASLTGAVPAVVIGGSARSPLPSSGRCHSRNCARSTALMLPSKSIDRYQLFKVRLSRARFSAAIRCSTRSRPSTPRRSAMRQMTWSSTSDFSPSA